MNGPRLEIRLDRIRHNAETLIARLGRRGIGVTGVTKATLGSPEIAGAMLDAGVARLGESRIENIEALRRAGVAAPIVLLRSPMLSQVRRVVASADASLNSEPAVLERLSAAASARGQRHGVVLMVELGDLREGILPADLDAVVCHALTLPGIELQGLGTNLACQSGVSPDTRNMGELSALVAATESRFGISLVTVSGGNSANLDWALGGAEVGRINDLRLGESILLGREPLRRRPIDGLHTDAFALVAEVIEAKVKPSRAWGDIQQTAFGAQERAVDRGDTARVILAVGHQDVDPAGLVAPPGFEILGASSDHLVLDAGAALPAVGDELSFGLDYGALLRAMTSPFVSRVFTGSRATAPTTPDAAGGTAGPRAPTLRPAPRRR